jgi:HD-GYP domain-containing protein (c-di-GMP phosphodiesterase class II)
MSATADTLSPVLEEQVTAARARRHRMLMGREAFGRSLMLAVFLTSAIFFFVTVDSSRSVPWWVYVGFVVAYAGLSEIHFEVGGGLALPTELVFVPMLFVLPVSTVPLVVGAGLALSAMIDAHRGDVSPLRAVVYPANGLFALAPAAVIALAGEPNADWHGGVVLVAALLAQAVNDFAASAAVERLALGVRARELVRPLATTFAIDLLVAPVAFAATIANRYEPGALLLPLPLVLLLMLFARERRGKLDSAIELSGAYRGTAFLLGDVIEADDAYTGEHSRQVVELVTAVGEQLRLNGRELQLAELTALLHDVGKIRIPAAIINKPGQLDEEERALMQTHAAEGEELLKRVGGLLGEVGTIVRSCHERWDGRGYPDGLTGEEIPLIARLVCCCDAYNAMTTDRPYRQALSVSAAIAELRTNAGTQFDPDVVEAFLRVAVLLHGRSAASAVSR